MRQTQRQELEAMDMAELKDLRDTYYAGGWIPYNYNYVLDEIESRLMEQDGTCGHDLAMGSELNDF